MEDKINATKEKCPCCRTKERGETEYRSLMNRLSRIEGQVRGVKGMIEKDAYCIDVLTQVAAITAALNAFNKELLGNHIRTCVTDDLKNGKEETAEELIDVLQRLMR
ncbi:MAG: metal-sensing transcriptional repressor [Clostridia bacterium]|nr:metal-sensing transcriptional repressor [Clostridia bacterium]